MPLALFNAVNSWGILVHFKVSAYFYFFMWLRFYDTALPVRSTDRLDGIFLIRYPSINVLVVGVALIVGSYFNLQGWALLLATTPARSSRWWRH